MTQSFDLVNEPWLPCFFGSEPRSVDLSLRETLARAHEIRELLDPSPPTTPALHRLLLAIVHRCFGPTDVDAWARLYQAGRFDMAMVDRYLDTWRRRFDLFDVERPFYQTAGLPVSLASSVAKLTLPLSAGNNPTLFDHSVDNRPIAMMPAAAARALITIQAFAVGSLVSRMPGDPPSATATHLMKAAVTLALGNTLFETLLFNLVALDGRRGEPFYFDPAMDLPAWELSEPAGRDEAPRGYLDLLTWQARRCLLMADDTQPDDRRVSSVVVMAGRDVSAVVDIRQLETMVAYTRSDAVAKRDTPWLPLGFRPERALWRDSTALLQRSDTRHRPGVFRWLDDLRSVGVLPADSDMGLAAFGLSSDRAKVFLWRQERLPLPTAYVSDRDLVAELDLALVGADRAAGALHRGTRRLVELAVSPKTKPDAQRISQIVSSLAPARGYWPTLDLPFRTLMTTLAKEFPGDGGRGAQGRWGRAVQVAARGAFRRAAQALATSGRAFRAEAEATPMFNRYLSDAVGPLLDSTDQAGNRQEVSP